MAIFRGIGGAGDSTTDATVTAVTEQATNAANSATAAASSASSASTSASAAAASASAAASSAAVVASAETNVLDDVLTSAANAAAAASSATAAASSASDAASSASDAQTAQTAAEAAESNASTSALAASSSASSASSSASTATTQATNAASSASAAATSATNAANSATTASGYVSDAADQVALATTQATNAANSATAASSSASSAASSAAAAAASLDSFDDRYLGAKSSAPTLDNDGNALVTGALYYDTTEGLMFVYDGGQWIAASSASQAILTVYKYTATSGQTTFSGVDDNAATLGYTVGSIIVTLNGVFLESGDDYTATNGSSVVLSAGATTSDEVNIYSFNTFDVANVQVIGDERYVRLSTDQTVAGTKTLSSNPVLSAGTANGVTYLNGSKVLTSGSGLTFDGSILTTPRLGQSGSGTYGYFNSTGAGNAWASYQYNSSEIGEIGQGSGIISGGSSTDFGIRATNNLVFGISYIEKMRLTSTGLGIGTSSPSAQLQLNRVGTSEYTTFRLSNSGASGKTYEIGVGGNAAAAGYANNLYFYDSTAGALRMTLDSSGNLGLGVTPSAWDGSLIRAIQIGNNNGSISSFTTGNTSADWLFLNNNAYYDGAWKYAATSTAAQYAITAGEHRFFTAPSGSAGGTIPFSQAMTLDADGNLLVGGTSAKGQITSIKSSSTTTFSSLGHGMLGLQNTSNTNNNYTWMNFYESNGNYVGAIGTLNEVHASASSSVKGSLVFATKQSGVGGYPVERLRIDSSGNLNIGDSGNFGGKLSLAFNPASQHGIILAVSSATFTNDYIAFQNSGGSKIGSISSNNSSVAYNTSSDYRLKENVVGVTSASERVQQLNPVRFNFIADPDRTVDGFLAHEVAEVVPEAITGEKDALDADGNPKYQGIDQSKLVPLLTAALQEALAKIESLTARVSALEGN